MNANEQLEYLQILNILTELEVLFEISMRLEAEDCIGNGSEIVEQIIAMVEGWA